VTLTLKLGTNEVNYPVVTTDASGFFTVSVSGLASGTYGWRAKGPQYLANSGSLTLAGAPVTSVEMGLMLAGDANNDNVITVIDVSILRGTFGKSCGDAGYDGRADFTGDCMVTAVDFGLLKNDFGMGGAPPLTGK
jgi:hypothetical protein